MEAIKAYLRYCYSDEKLAMLLAHAEDDKLTFYSCCCFIGIATADHALRGTCRKPELVSHYIDAAARDTIDAEKAFFELGETDAVRRQRLLPLIREEMARRDHKEKDTYVSLSKTSPSWI